MLQQSQRRARPLATDGDEGGVAVLVDVNQLGVQQRTERVNVVDEQQVLQWPRLDFDDGFVSRVESNRRAGRRVLVLADALELVEAVVAKLGRAEEEAALQDAEGGARRDRVEVADAQLAHGLVAPLEGHLVEVAVLRLQQDEEELLLPMERRRNEQQALLRWEVLPAREGATQVGVALVLVEHKVLRTDEDAAWALGAARDGHQQVGCGIDRIAPLAHDVVQPEVELIVDQILLVQHLARLLVVLDLLHVDLDGGEDGVVEAHVDADHVERQRVRLVRLEWARDCEACGRVAVERVHELLLLDGTDHHGAALRVGRDELARHHAPQPRLPVRLGVHLLEAALLVGVLEDDHLARVAAEHNVVAIAAGEPAGGERADDAEHIGGEDRLYLAVIVGPHQLQHLAPCHDDLLLARARKVAIQRRRDPAALLERERVEVHRGGCSGGRWRRTTRAQ
mmetsp:Transcript_50156/g.138959  ORF Transcript_50156/g.138959 Transcript_50156/m.138959 type:complete len:453 (-) Transcript_50156:46-1404(-)